MSYTEYKGYLGPGGLYNDEEVPGNCTGGATGYIDKQFFTINHIYQNPTPKNVYITDPFDPEGILGNAILWLKMTDLNTMNEK